uniref:Serine carboxypeptidase n=1 Tax=Panagrolaimus sp. ES5 TaxID=591445 RepID=A0AC34GR73_9BILA
MLLIFTIFVAFFCGSISGDRGEADLVKNVPGLIFQTNFKVYSGYLNGGKNNTWKMHYMLTESRGNATNDPLLFWFNGGPGKYYVSGDTVV